MIFFPLHPVPFCRQSIYHPGNINDLILGGFQVIPKIMFGNLCKLILDVTVIPVLSGL